MKKDLSKGVLYLIPTLLGNSSIELAWPAGNHEIVNSLDTFIVENIRTARRFLKQAGYTTSFDEVCFYLLDKHTKAEESMSFLDKALAGKDIGLLSEAGCPCIADPGQVIVARAHELGIEVRPLTGPSSIMLALMASGMNGQAFCFHGYLPIHKNLRVKKIKDFEKASRQTGATQIFMETPFRNMQLLEDLLKNCHPETSLCIAADLTTSDQYIRTYTISRWRNTQVPNLHKRPAVFLLIT